MKTMYHATKLDNLDSILSNGLKRNNCEHVIFLCEKPEDAAKFLLVQGIEQFVVIPVFVHEKFLDESFDHSFQFFKCRCWMYHKDIPPRNIDEFEMLEYDAKEGA